MKVERFSNYEDVMEKNLSTICNMKLTKKPVNGTLTKKNITKYVTEQKKSGKQNEQNYNKNRSEVLVENCTVNRR